MQARVFALAIALTLAGIQIPALADDDQAPPDALADGEMLGATIDQAVPRPVAEPLPPASEVLTPMAVSRVVGRAQPVQSCLHRAVTADQDLPAKIWVEFTVQPDGAIQGAAISTPGLLAENTESCLVVAIADQHFPSFESSVAKVIRIPLLPPTPSD